MGPLVYYCRWQRVKLRLLGRDEHFVWGRLVAHDEHNNERAEPFRFNIDSWELLLGEGEEQTRVQLDELGVAIPAADRLPTTSVDDSHQ